MLCWAVVEKEVNGMHRIQECVAVVCGGGAGLQDATDEDTYLGVTGPGEEVARLLEIEKELATEESGEEEEPVAQPPKVKGTGSVSILHPNVETLIPAAPAAEPPPAS